MTHPHVFISHASEDKERFVEGLALKLIGNGVNVWFDKWEIKLGDSLIDKIFEKGIKPSDFIIIVLSKNSINNNKKWVKEELNSASFIRIEEDIKIIPIVIDENIDIPTSLNHLKRISISNLSNYSRELDEIISTIFKKNIKPEIGEKPKYSEFIQPIQGLNNIDSSILKIIGDLVLKHDSIARIINASGLIDKLSMIDITTNNAKESLDILESFGYVEIYRYGGDIKNYSIKLTTIGFFSYCNYFLYGFESLLKDIISLILNDNISVNKDIASKTGLQLSLISGILDYFEYMGYIKLSTTSEGIQMIFKIHAIGRRNLIKIMES